MTGFQFLLSLFFCIVIDNFKNASSEVYSSEEFVEFNRYKEPTVFIAILVRNKAQTLPFFLTCLERLKYSKSRIHLWIRSDHNEDKSIEILQEWLAEWAAHYHGVDAEFSSSPPYRLPEENGPAHWPLSRYSHIISLREKALNAARNMWADFVWLLDSDVFLSMPESLTELVKKQLPIAVPMLKSDGLYSNFWCGMNDDYYYLRTDDYEPILNQKKTGCFSVPMVHSAVLINLNVEQSDELTFMPNRLANYKGPHDDIITFALSANFTGVPLFICNDHIYGYVMVPLDKDDSLSYDKLQLTNLRLEIMVDSPPLEVSGLLKHWVDVPAVDHLGVDRVFMINLLRRPERRRRMNECFRILGVNATVVDAVDGQLLNDSTLQEMGVHLMEGYVDPYHKRPMKRGEIGCFLSHYYIWKEILEDDSLDKVIVLEDDVRFEPFFRQKMDSILSELEKFEIPWDLVYLGRKRLQEAEESTFPGSQYLVYPNYSYWTLGYMLSKSGAKKLMDANPLDNLLPVDEFLPILYDKHPDENWKSYFPKRDVLALSAEPLIIYPTRYLHEEGYVSDTEDSLPISTTPRIDL
ncbi:glycosyltransferase 25 family member isoform X2 [Nilaparvata lugens]|uniref:glycosyltransferase 25 family member isoform X2 n=1 Tax=Nilaparvata lugens TaxID=108931 RepID=UPI00193D1884|nr:glycosyltransferase 25 family member isoform X2 [Nilaparvata lugens]